MPRKKVNGFCVSYHKKYNFIPTSRQLLFMPGEETLNNMPPKMAEFISGEIRWQVTTNTKLFKGGIEKGSEYFQVARSKVCKWMSVLVFGENFGVV